MEAFYLETQGGWNLFGTKKGGPNCVPSNLFDGLLSSITTASLTLMSTFELTHTTSEGNTNKFLLVVLTFRLSTIYRGRWLNWHLKITNLVYFGSTRLFERLASTRPATDSNRLLYLFLFCFTSQVGKNLLPRGNREKIFNEWMNE